MRELEGEEGTFWRKSPLPLPEPLPFSPKDFRPYRIPILSFSDWQKALL